MSTTTAAAVSNAPSVRTQRIVWVLQILLALAFLAHGAMFLNPPPDIAVLMNASLPRWFQVFLGVAEVLAAVGLTIPALTGVQPSLVTWAAGGVMIVVGSATVYHIARGEFSSAVVTAVLFAMAAIVARTRRSSRPRT